MQETDSWYAHGEPQQLRTSKDTVVVTAGQPLAFRCLNGVEWSTRGRQLEQWYSRTGVANRQLRSLGSDINQKPGVLWWLCRYNRQPTWDDMPRSETIFACSLWRFPLRRNRSDGSCLRAGGIGNYTSKSLLGVGKAWGWQIWAGI